MKAQYDIHGKFLDDDYLFYFRFENEALRFLHSFQTLFILITVSHKNMYFQCHIHCQYKIAAFLVIHDSLSLDTILTSPYRREKVRMRILGSNIKKKSRVSNAVTGKCSQIFILNKENVQNGYFCLFVFLFLTFPIVQKLRKASGKFMKQPSHLMRSHEHLLSIALILFSQGTQAALKFSKSRRNFAHF